MNSDKSATKSGLVGRYLTVLDLKTSCRALSACMRWTKTICQPTALTSTNCHETQVNKRLFQHGGYRLGPRPKRGKGLITWAGLARLAGLLRCAEMTFRLVLHGASQPGWWLSDEPWENGASWNVQSYDKKSASVRQPLKTSAGFSSPWRTSQPLTKASSFPINSSIFRKHVC